MTAAPGGGAGVDAPGPSGQPRHRRSLLARDILQLLELSLFVPINARAALGLGKSVRHSGDVDVAVAAQGVGQDEPALVLEQLVAPLVRLHLGDEHEQLLVVPALEVV